MDRETTPAKKAAKDIADTMQKQLEDVTAFLTDVQRSIEEPLEGQCTIPEFDFTLTAPQIAEEEAAHMSAAEYLRRTSTPESREEARRALDMLEQEKAQIASMTASDGHIMTSKEMLEQSAKIAQENTAADTIAETIFIDTDVDPELDPNSPLFNETKYLEALASIDYKAISDRLREQMDRIRASYTQLLHMTDFQGIPETLEGARAQIMQAVKATGSLLENRDILEAALTGVIERLMALTPAELEALQEEAQEATEDGKPAAPPAPLEAIIEEATADAIKGYMRQGQATAQLTKIKATKRNTKIDPVTHTATITAGSMTVTIPNYDALTGLKTSTYKLLDALTTILTETGAKSPAVTMPLDDYMKLRGLRDRKEARKQVAEDLDTLYNTSISFKEKRKGKEGRDFLDMRICDAKGIKKGVIFFSFGSTFFHLLKGYSVMPVQPQLWALNDKRNPNSYYLLRKLMEHKNMNAGKRNEDLIAVKSLLEACPNIPRYNEVMSQSRHVNRLIIEPFERDMNALEDTLTWEYCHRNGDPLTGAELDTFSYEVFAGALIRTIWKNYPDQTERLERKQARIEEAKAKRKRGRKQKPAEEE